MKIMALLFVLATPAYAQTIMFGIDANGTLQGDWAGIEQCAAKPYPAPNDTDQRSYQLADRYFHQINLCRTLLAGRHAGWIAAGRAASDNPFQPQPMFRDGDFKEKLVCDYGKLNKSGAGMISCNADVN